MGENGVDAIEHEHKKWINQTKFGNNIGYLNIASITQYYSSEYKRQRYETQDCEDY